jgi:hypothetical protein
MKNQSLPASLITMVVGGGCVGAQIVLRFHPKCESTRSAHWTSCLFRPMFHLRRSDAIVVPVPPEALHGRLWVRLSGDIRAAGCGVTQGTRQASAAMRLMPAKSSAAVGQ